MALLPTLLARRPRAAQGYAVIDGAIVADLRGFADHRPHPRIDEQPLADARAGMDLDAGEHPPEMRHEAASQMPAALPEPVGEAVIEQRLETGVAQHDL